MKRPLSGCGCLDAVTRRSSACVSRRRNAVLNPGVNGRVWHKSSDSTQNARGLGFGNDKGKIEAIDIWTHNDLDNGLLSAAV